MGDKQSSLEGLVMDSFWNDKRVLVTGHTGFKGSWLSLWLLQMGAKVYGYALEPETRPSLFESLLLVDDIDHFTGDVRDSNAVNQRVLKVCPNIVFHLAAQPLVRRAYREPRITWETNVLGTVNVLEAVRLLPETCAVVVVTTDKVYENREWCYSYREDDALGGIDPYSSSKAAAEIAVNSWRRSFFINGNSVRVASARAGNVIGGGDWSEDRILPDFMRAISRGKVVAIRNPSSVRPWQHVLEPLSGYLKLACRLHESPEPSIQTAFNFGPAINSSRTVNELVAEALKLWPGSVEYSCESNAPHEAALLSLTVEKAQTMLNWRPRWGFEKTVKATVEWYRSVLNGANPRECCTNDIKEFCDR
jgi:CDP-glucose 4,6-dehydratase